jgi:Ca2+-binding RTX toxin-like protein
LIAALALGMNGLRADTVGFNEQPLDGWDTDGTVYAVKIVGSVAYIGGDFSSIAAPGGSSVARENLAGIDMTTGAVTAFQADTNGVVRAIEDDGSDLWIGGTFTAVEGTTRNRLAVVDGTTGDLRTINPGMSGAVNSLRRSGSYMYVGGAFAKIGGVVYDRIARLNLTDGSPDSGWDVTANASVQAIAIPAAGDIIYLGGGFTSVNGDARSYVVGVAASTGQVTTPAFENLEYSAIALDVDPAGDHVMAGLSGLGNRLVVWDPVTGEESWRVRVGGDVQAVKYHAGNVYFGFHDHYQDNPFVKVLAADVNTGLVEAWRPAIPSFWGVWAIDASSSDGLVIGGQFNSVEGISTRNVAIFEPLAQADSTPPTTPQNVAVASATETRITLSWDAASDNVGVTAYTVWRDGTQVGVSVDSSFDDFGNLPGDEFTYVITAGDNAANESEESTPLLAATVTGMVDVGDGWSYLDDGSDQGTAWRQPGFDDGAWPTGPAELGFGDGGEATVLSSGAITYYFRHDFFLAALPTVDATMAVKRDDGAVVYLNGVEVWRDNMPGGSVSAATLASETVAGDDEDVFHGATIPVGAFQLGANEIAVEVHQAGPGSSDLSFDLALWGDATLDEEPPTVPDGLAVIGVSATTIDLTWNESTDDTAVTKYTVRRGGVVVGSATAAAFRDSGLTPNTTYEYTVEAEDAAGNQSGQSAAKSATTDPDTTPPTVPAPLTAGEVTAFSVELSWGTATDDVGVTGYELSRDGIEVATIGGTAYTDGGLDPATTYVYRVVALDAAGNESVAAGPLEVTTAHACDGATVTIVGTEGDDVIEGTDGRDVIHGLGGDDVIYGRAGNDIICGGDGADKIVGHGGRDVLSGGAGQDVLKGKKGDDELRGNKGSDRLVGGLGDDTLSGGGGTDEASFASLALAVVADLSEGSASGQGADTLAGIEDLEGSSEADTLAGDAGPNRLIGGGSGDLLRGRGGDDAVLGKSGGDELYGGSGDDLVKGGRGNDELYGGSGFDVLIGGSGSDTCSQGEDLTAC